MFKFFKSIWFWWIILTVIYFSLSVYGTQNHIFGFVGLFVPFGPLSLVYFFPSSYFILTFIRSVFSAIIFFYGAHKFHKWLKSQQFGFGKSIILILFALLFLTSVVDIVRGTGLASWKIFLTGNIDIDF